jgi:hypothetical protein
LGVVAIALGAGLAPASAGAQGTAVEYPPDVNERSFVTSDGGWEKASQASESETCVGAVTCPEVSNAFVPTGGTLGAADGYMSTEITAVTGVGSQVRGVLLSPVFTYDGVAGVKPSELAFSVSHLANIDPGVSLAGNSVGYTVELVDVTAGEQAVQVIDQPLAKSDASWTAAPPASLPPGSLTVGHKYRVRIMTTFTSGAQAFQSGKVGYDDVRLVATQDTPPADDGNGGGGGPKPGGGNAVFDGRNLWLRLKCLGMHSKAQSKHRCHVRATALAAKRGGRRYTFPVQRKVQAKKGKMVRARVRFQFRKKLESRRTITLKSVIRANGEERTVYEKLKLIKRAN